MRGQSDGTDPKIDSKGVQRLDPSGEVVVQKAIEKAVAEIKTQATQVMQMSTGNFQKRLLRCETFIKQMRDEFKMMGRNIDD